MDFCISPRIEDVRTRIAAFVEREILRIAEAAHGDPADHLLPGLALEVRGVDVGRDVAGAQRVDPDAEARPFERQHLGHLHDARLRDHVGRGAADDAMA